MILKMQLTRRGHDGNNEMSRMMRQIMAWSGRRGLLAALWLFLIPAIGHCSISIMPMEVQLPVTHPGARLTNDIEVYNSGDAAIHVTSSVMDWSMTLSGHKQFHEPGTQPLSCALWIQLNPVEFSLAPGKSMRVRYSIATPVDMTQEHWAMIFFTSRTVPKESDNRFALSIQTRIGCSILVTPASEAPLQGKITAMTLQTLAAPETQPAAPAGSPLLPKVQVTFVNPNPVSVRLTGTVEARSTDGQLIATGKITPAKALVLTGATRELSAQFDKPLPPGAYQIKAVIDYGGKELIGGTLNATVEPPAAGAIPLHSPPSEAKSEKEKG